MGVVVLVRKPRWICCPSRFHPSAGLVGVHSPATRTSPFARVAHAYPSPPLSGGGGARVCAGGRVAAEFPPAALASLRLTPSGRWLARSGSPPRRGGRPVTARSPIYVPPYPPACPGRPPLPCGRCGPCPCPPWLMVPHSAYGVATKTFRPLPPPGRRPARPALPCGRSGSVSGGRPTTSSVTREEEPPQVRRRRSGSGRR